MDFNGFVTKKDKWGIAVEFAMPSILAESYFTRLFCRGPLNDEACGEPEAVWSKLAPEYDARNLAAPVQVHGTRIIEADERCALSERPKADGIFLPYDADVLGSLRFADCTPVVIAGVAERPWLVMLHSGFQGTLKNISAAALDLVEAKYRTQRAENIWAWIGPAIGRECYGRKTDDPSTAAALAAFSAENIDDGDSDFIHFDIKGQIRSQLCAKGIRDDNIYTYDRCTFCAKDLFYSYRAGDDKKRLFLLAGAIKNGRTRENSN
ncbi:MAG: polyphenol oxidase family protein [Cloacibacillus sp.]